MASTSSPTRKRKSIATAVRRKPPARQTQSTWGTRKNATTP
jgi:hypothetical protein